MLYPERKLPGFLAENVVPEAKVEADAAAEGSCWRGEPVRSRARCRRASTASTANSRMRDDLAAVLDDLANRTNVVRRGGARPDRVLDLFEEVFQHKSYTGRSGCHVRVRRPRLHLLAHGRQAAAGRSGNRSAGRARRPARGRPGRSGRMYFRIRAGLGYEKTVAEYGAFPTDPYSHTPPGGRSQAAGHDRPGERGNPHPVRRTRRARATMALVGFRPVLLRRVSSWWKAKNSGILMWTARIVRMVSFRGQPGLHLLPGAGDLRNRRGERWIKIDFHGRTIAEIAGDMLDAELSGKLFARSGRIERIQVGIPAAGLRQH